MAEKPLRAPTSRCPLPSPTPSPPALAWPRRIKFKGFKCKYFSFIDASCLQRARLLAAQLYCPISFPYLGPGEPGGRGRGARLPRRGRSWRPPPGDRVGGGGAGWTGWGGVGWGGRLSDAGPGEAGAGAGAVGGRGVLFSFRRNKGSPPRAHRLPFSPRRVSPPRPLPRRPAASPFTGARRRSQSEAIRIENLCKTAVN